MCLMLTLRILKFGSRAHQTGKRFTRMPFVEFHLTNPSIICRFGTTSTKNLRLSSMNHTSLKRNLLGLAGFLLLLGTPVSAVGQAENSITPSEVFTYDEADRIGNVYDMVELKDGVIAVTGDYGVAYFDAQYNITEKKKFGDFFRNVSFVQVPDGLGVAGSVVKTLNEELKLPYLFILQPDLESLDEYPLCPSCSVVGAADFDGNGVDSVVAWGDDIITVLDLTDSSVHEISKMHFDTKLCNSSRSEVVDLNCDGMEEWLFRSKVEAVLEHQNEWAQSKYFLLYFDEQFNLVDYGSYLEENWNTIRSCSMSQMSKKLSGMTRYVDGNQVQLSPGNIGFHRTDNPVQKFLHLFNISDAVEQSWEVRMTGMRRAVNFYSVVDTDCLNENANIDGARKNCSRYISVYRRWGPGCEQFFWENDDCGSWVLLLEPDGSWELIATWPEGSSASLLTSDGRLLLHPPAGLLEIKLPTHLVPVHE